MRDISSSFKGFSIPQRDLMHKLHEYGWQLDKINNKKDGYEVKLKNQFGEKLDKKAEQVETALAQALLDIAHRHLVRTSAWNHTWVHQLVPIATAYAKAPIFDHKAAVGWKALGDDAMARKPYLEDQLKVEYTHDLLPYKSGKEMADDIRKGKVKIPLAEIDSHPIWTPEQVLAHRLSHNVLGRAHSGAGHDWAGANAAVAAHMPYLSREAQKALFTDELARKAYQTHFQGYGPIKIAYLEDFLNQDTHNDFDHVGEPPEHSFTPWGI